MSGVDMNDLARQAGPGAVARSIQAAVPTKPDTIETSPTSTAWPEGDGYVGGMLDTPPPPRRWFVKNRLLMGRAGILSGIGAAGKTQLAYHLAVAGVIGRLPWDWTVETTGTVLLFLTEDTAEDVHHSLSILAEDLDDDERAALSERLRIFPLAGQDTRLLSMNGQTIFENARGMGLIEKCQEYPDVCLIFLDPAAALSEGSELDQAHQRYLGQYVDKLAIKTGACVMLITHSTKASAGADEITSHQSRGGGAITDAVRSEFVMRTMTAREAASFGIDDATERKAHVQLVCTKGNKLPSEAYAPMWLRRGSGGMLVPAQLTPGQANESRANLMDVQLRDVLRELVKTATPTLAEWRGECERRRLIVGASEQARKKAMDRAVSRLVSSGLIDRGIGRGIYTPTDQGSA